VEINPNTTYRNYYTKKRLRQSGMSFAFTIIEWLDFSFLFFPVRGVRIGNAAICEGKMLIKGA
jgi:hypothetical protein